MCSPFTFEDSHCIVQHLYLYACKGRLRDLLGDLVDLDYARTTPSVVSSCNTRVSPESNRGQHRMREHGWRAPETLRGAHASGPSCFAHAECEVPGFAPVKCELPVRNVRVRAGQITKARAGAGGADVRGPSRRATRRTRPSRGAVVKGLMGHRAKVPVLE